MAPMEAKGVHSLNSSYKQSRVKEWVENIPDDSSPQSSSGSPRVLRSASKRPSRSRAVKRLMVTQSSPESKRVKVAATVKPNMFYPTKHQSSVSVRKTEECTPLCNTLAVPVNLVDSDSSLSLDVCDIFIVNKNKDKSVKYESESDSQPTTPRKLHRLTSGLDSSSSTTSSPLKAPFQRSTHVSASISTKNSSPSKAPTNKNTSSKTPINKYTPSKTPINKYTPSKTPINKYTPSKTPNSKSSPVKVKTPFSKLGNRLYNKSPIQYYMDSMKKSKRIKTPRRRLSACKTVSTSRNSSTSGESVRTPTTHDLSATMSDTGNTVDNTSLPLNSILKSSNKLLISHNSSTVSHSTVKTETNPIDIGDDRDKENTTLTDIDENAVNNGKITSYFKKINKSIDDDQMVIDVGQSDLNGVRRCSTCMMIYSKSSPADEALHKRFHSQLMSVLKCPGWKGEHIAEIGYDYRIIYIEQNDAQHFIKKVQSLKEILDQELGYVHENNILSNNRKVYLYIGDDRLIKGICIAEFVTKASRYLGDSVSQTVYPARLGINRIWVYAKSRRQGIATRLLDSVRCTYSLGSCIPLTHVAFSDPTAYGKRFAVKYTKTEQFLVYKPQ